jgi:hypothetical protein
MKTYPLAFPLAIQAEGSGSSYTETYYEGMTLRDYFAIRFAAVFYPQAQCSEQTVCAIAYRMADCMLAEREKEPAPPKPPPDDSDEPPF